MRVMILTGLLALAFAPLAPAWAILLDSPSLQYPAAADAGIVSATEAEMKKLKFDSGIIHVSAPAPTRTLRFKSPGQDANTLLRLLRKLGFKVVVSSSASLPEQHGMIISQPEDGSRSLSVVINSQHPGFDRKRLDSGEPRDAGDCPPR